VHFGLRAMLAFLMVTLLVIGVVGAIVVGNPDQQVIEAVATQADAAEVDPLLDPDGPGFERHLSRFAEGEQIRADAQAQEDAALAAAAQMAEQEAAAQAAAEEQTAADAAAAENAAALEFAAALAEDDAPAPAPAGPPTAPSPSPTPTPPPVQGDPFDALAQCESGRNPQAYNSRGPWYGAFQFAQATWNQYAGGSMPGDPRQYSYAQQKTVAQRLQAARGWAPWPSCARQLGLL